MRRLTTLSLTLLAPLIIVACSEEATNVVNSTTANTGDCAADLVLHNTSVYTSNRDQWTAQAVGLNSGLNRTSTGLNRIGLNSGLNRD